MKAQQAAADERARKAEEKKQRKEEKRLFKEKERKLNGNSMFGSSTHPLTIPSN